MNKGHVHAELMAQYAEDAKKTARPWERWQVKGPEMIRHVSNPRDKDGYITCECHPSWHPNHVYRRKPAQVQVAGEVFDDVLLHLGDHPDGVYLVQPNLSMSIRRVSSYEAGPHLSTGRVHSTYEGALRHLNALRPKVL